MVILGIDPSIVETGFCVCEEGKILDCGVIKTSSKDSQEKRLYEIHQDIQTLCKEYLPSILAIETQYIDVSRINNSVLKTVEARGVIEGTFWACRQKGKIIPVHPMSVKSYMGMTGKISRDVAKKFAVDFVRKNFPDIKVKNHNIADAVIISLVAKNLYDSKITS